MATPHKGIALLMGEPPDDDEHDGAEGDDDGPSDEARTGAKKAAMDAFIKSVHAMKEDEALSAFETLMDLCEKKSGDEPAHDEPAEAGEDSDLP